MKQFRAKRLWNVNWQLKKRLIESCEKIQGVEVALDAVTSAIEEEGKEIERRKIRRGDIEEKKGNGRKKTSWEN